MIRRLALMLAGALWLTGCSAPDPLDGHDWPAATPALWHVNAPDGGEGWLFGTVHALPDGVEWHTPVLDDALAKSQLLVVEIAQLDDAGLAADEFAKRAYAPGLPPLDQRIPAGPDRDLLAQLIARGGADAADLARMKSWAAALSLSGAVRSGDPANGVDRALQASGKPLLGLEGYAAQFALFDALPEQDQRSLLLSVAREANSYDPVKAIESWLTGDMRALAAQGDSGMLADPALREALLDSRNRAWAEQIVPLVRDGRKPFVAVGAAHMAGSSGLPALLAARGLVVERVQ